MHASIVALLSLNGHTDILKICLKGRVVMKICFNVLHDNIDMVIRAQLFASFTACRVVMVVALFISCEIAELEFQEVPYSDRFYFTCILYVLY